MTSVLRQAALTAAVIGVVVSAAFLIAAGTPWTYLDEAQLTSTAAPDQIARLRAARGLDRSAASAYRDWVLGILRGDLGRSVVYDQPVATLLWPRAVNTVALTASAGSIAWMIALPLGLWSAGRPRRGGGAVGFSCRVLTAVPEPLLIIGVMAAAGATGWLPAGGSGPLAPEGVAGHPPALALVRHLAAPAFATALLLAPSLTLQIRDAIALERDAPFIVAARARGVGERRLTTVHALKAALPTIVPLAGLTGAWLLSGSLVVETLFDWPGLGPLTVEAVLNRDRPLVAAVVLMTAAVVLGALAGADAALRALDPRARREAVR